MINLSEKSRYKNIKKLYNIQKITEEGYIFIGNKSISIYRVEPINIINSDDEYKLKIYSTYLACVKNFTNIQIIVKTEKQNFNSQIQFYNKKIEQLESEELKKAIKKYVEYLKEQNTLDNYSRQIFVITDNSNSLVNNEMMSFEQNLLNIGIRMNKVKDLEEIKQILKESISREKISNV